MKVFILLAIAPCVTICDARTDLSKRIWVYFSLIRLTWLHPGRLVLARLVRAEAIDRNCADYPSAFDK